MVRRFFAIYLFISTHHKAVFHAMNKHAALVAAPFLRFRSAVLCLNAFYKHFRINLITGNTFCFLPGYQNFSSSFFALSPLIFPGTNFTDAVLPLSAPVSYHPHVYGTRRPDKCKFFLLSPTCPHTFYFPAYHPKSAQFLQNHFSRFF